MNRAVLTEKGGRVQETELAANVVEWLREQHWEVYQEVQPHAFDRTADIVAVNGHLLWVIEVKKSLSLALLEQALRWRGYANYISIATPRPTRHTRGEDAARLFVKHFGIGRLSIRRRSMLDNVDQVVPPQLSRRRRDTLKDCLNEHHKTYAQAGNAEGKRWTPFRQTCMELQRVVYAQPGIHLKEAIDKTRHHYHSDSTARACISKYLQMNTNIVRGVRCEREGRYLRLYPNEEE